MVRKRLHGGEIDCIEKEHSSFKVYTFAIILKYNVLIWGIVY